MDAVCIKVTWGNLIQDKIKHNVCYTKQTLCIAQTNIYLNIECEKINHLWWVFIH
uniref:Uncharacterized protein n=1 Tax=Rhizophora mucronata TaxID=61149 RepID=A0A2P2NZB8_RHIMU